MRMRVPVGVSYASNPREVEKVLLAVAADNKNVLRHPTPQVHFVAMAAKDIERNDYVMLFEENGFNEVAVSPQREYQRYFKRFD